MLQTWCEEVSWEGERSEGLGKGQTSGHVDSRQTAYL